MNNFEQIKNLDEVNAAIKEHADFVAGTVELSTKNPSETCHPYDDMISYYIGAYGGPYENFDFVISFHSPSYISLPCSFDEDFIVIKVLGKEFVEQLLLERTCYSQKDIDSWISYCYSEYDSEVIDEYVFGIFYKGGKFTNSFVCCKGVTAQFIE